MDWSMLGRRGRRVSCAVLCALVSLALTSCNRTGPCAEQPGPIVFISSAVDFENGEPLDEIWIEDVRFDGESVDPAWLYFPPESGAFFDGTRIVCAPPCEIPGDRAPRHTTVEVELDLAAPGYVPRVMTVTSIYETVESGPCGNYVEGDADVVVAMAPEAP